MKTKHKTTTYAVYRQELRDFPDTITDWLADPEWPMEPEA